MREPPGADWTFFGKHRHRFEAPDLYFVNMRGDVSAEDMQAQLEALGSLGRRSQCGIFWLCDVRDMGALTQEARRAAAGASKGELRSVLRGSAVFGAAFSTRVVITLLVRAVRLLNPSKLRPLAFVETEAEARAFLVQNGQGKRSSLFPQVEI